MRHLFGGLIVLTGVSALIVGAFYAGTELSACEDKQARFERTYATVSEHAVEFAYWCLHHARAGFLVSEGRADRAIRSVAALSLAMLMLAVPVATVAVSGDATVKAHGLAAGIGALVWGLVLETSSLSQRVKVFSERILRPEPWLWAILLCFSDIAVLIVTAWVGIGDDRLKAMMIGVSYVAVADLISTYVGFVLCPWHRYPLAGP